MRAARIYDWIPFLLFSCVFKWWPYIYSHIALVDLSLYVTLKRCFPSLHLLSFGKKTMPTLLHGLTNPSSLSSLAYMSFIHTCSRFSLPINYFISKVFIDKSHTSFFNGNECLEFSFHIASIYYVISYFLSFFYRIIMQ